MPSITFPLCSHLGRLAQEWLLASPSFRHAFLTENAFPSFLAFDLKVRHTSA